MVKNLFLWLIIAIVLVSVFSNFGPRNSVTEKVSYSQFLKEVEQGMISSVTVEDNKVIKGMTKNNKHFVTYMPMPDNALLGQLLKSKVDVIGQEKQQESFLLHWFMNWLPMLLLVGLWVFFMRQMQGGGGRGAMSFGRSRARLLGEDQVKVTFADVAGVYVKAGANNFTNTSARHAPNYDHAYQAIVQAGYEQGNVLVGVAAQRAKNVDVNYDVRNEVAVSGAYKVSPALRLKASAAYGFKLADQSGAKAYGNGKYLQGVVGADYAFSKRTMVNGQVGYTQFGNKANNNRTGAVSMGMSHKF